MKQLYEDLWQTRPEQPFSGVYTHAYLLKCPQGNVFMYNTGHADEIEHISKLGGIKYQYLSHRDEAGETLQTIRQRFGSELCCHIKEVAAISSLCSIDVVFSENQTHFAGIEVLHTPGHTDGSISFLYNSPTGKTYLFTGDTLFQTNLRWQTLVRSGAGGTSSSLIESLERYKHLHPDVVIWSASGGGPVAIAETTSANWQNDLNRIIENLKK